MINKSIICIRNTENKGKTSSLIQFAKYIEQIQNEYDIEYIEEKIILPNDNETNPKDILLVIKPKFRNRKKY